MEVLQPLILLDIYIKKVGSSDDVGVHRTRLWRESIDLKTLLQAIMGATAQRVVFSKPYSVITNQTAHSNIVNTMSIYTDGSKTT